MLEIDSKVWAETLEHLRACGRGRRECVVYWTAAIGSLDRVDGLVHPAHSASASQYEIDETWLNGFWLNLAAARRSVRVQVHTHHGRAFHSDTDDRWPLIHTSGFLSLVIPRFAATDPAVDELFLAEYRGDGVWREVPVTKRFVGGPC